MKRCPDCGFRTEDKICPLCGVRTRECDIPTHVHTAQAPCLLERQQPKQPAQTRQKPLYQFQSSSTKKPNNPAMLILKIFLGIIALQILGTLLSLIF